MELFQSRALCAGISDINILASPGRRSSRGKKGVILEGRFGDVDHQKARNKKPKEFSGNFFF